MAATDCLSRLVSQYNIRVKTICSGVTNTDLNDSHFYDTQVNAHTLNQEEKHSVMAGFIQSRRIAAPAEPYEMNISPHNANSYLSTFITAHACASVPDVRIIGIGVDRTQWPR